MQNLKFLQPQTCLFFAGKQCFKTSFLLHYACSFLKNHTNPQTFVYFIGKKTIIHKINHYITKGIRKGFLKNEGFFVGKDSPFNSDVLKRVQMIFIDNGLKGLMDFVLNFELLPENKKPSLILFDDISEYLFLYLSSIIY